MTTETTTIIVSPQDLILDRWDKKGIADHQGTLLATYLPNWTYYRPVPGQSSLRCGIFPVGSYCEIYSPIFTDKADLEKEVQKVHEGFAKFIIDLNKQGKTVSRIDCWLEQSNDYAAVPHPLNDNKASHDLYIKNKDYKHGTFPFGYIFQTENFHKDTVFGNKFILETNKKCKVTKKYFTLKIDSPWLSI
jgi:hypothetical protein